jgi:hypothetical protein
MKERKLIPMMDYIELRHTDLIINGGVDEAFREYQYKTYDYATFLKLPLPQELSKLKKLFNEDIKYVNIQPSTEWNYYTLNGKKLCGESRQGLWYISLKTIEDLISFDLTLTDYAINTYKI